MGVTKKYLMGGGTRVAGAAFDAVVVRLKTREGWELKLWLG